MKNMLLSPAMLKLARVNGISRIHTTNASPATAKQVVRAWEQPCQK
eukprot:CAMPEP_0117618860 /NCGR_PEP_ID=MMETSP0784-20121206/86322_1 /TAXON_ID=39447 /ORGANISM="" /LENGTH=45 /DNA_ID= /DNA_START= /DNA_END= /DNA_ORIENTATION=